jgi:glucokinase
MLLAGDIGGTKTTLGIFSSERGPRHPLERATFPSGQFPSLEELVVEFLRGVSLPVTRASFGVAGPVIEGTANITNLPWRMDEKELAQTLGLRSVRLLNDLVAIAHGISELGSGDLHAINAGEPVREGSVAVIAPGTGLGEAFLVWDGKHHRVCPSEGGHADFAPADEPQTKLLVYLQRKYGHVSFERVCSGIGLPNIYAYLRDSGFAPEPNWLARKLAEAADPTPVMVAFALNPTQGSELCTQTLQMFISILASEAGNLTLKILATGGVYLGGGIPPRILPLIDPERFMTVFADKGRFSEMLHKVPVHVILNPEIALFGAAVHGLEEMPD